MINLRSGYKQHRVTGEDILNTVIRNRYGHYESLEKSFGVINAPTTFMDLMKRVYQNYLDSFVSVIINNILVYLKNEGDHMNHLRVLLKVIKENQLFETCYNCEFLLRSVAFFPHIISSEGVEFNPRKT